MANEFIARKGLKALNSSTIEGTGTVLDVLSGASSLLKVADTGAVTFNNVFTFPTADGTTGQVLQTNGAGALAWATPSVVAALDDLSDVDTTTTAPVSGDFLEFDGSNWVPVQLDQSTRFIEGYNLSSITKGDPVRVLSQHPDGTPEFEKVATGDTPYVAPVGLAVDTYGTLGSQVTVITHGVLTGMNTVAYSAGDPLYVASGGGLTNSTSVSGGRTQVGFVLSSHASLGEIYVNTTNIDENRFDLEYILNRGSSAAGASVNVGTFTASSTNTGSGVVTGMTLYRNSSSPADGDDLMRLSFTGNNDLLNPLAYGEIYATADAVTNPNEKGRLTFRTYNAGSFWDTGLEVHEGTISIGDTSPYTMPGADGTANYVLQTDGAGVASWVDPGTLSTSVPTLAQVTAAGSSTTGNISVNGKTQGSSSSNVTIFEAITTDSSAGEWPALNLWRLSSSPTVGDNVASITFLGMNSAASPFYYGKISAEIGNSNTGVEDGEIVIYRGDGTLAGDIQEVARWTEDGLEMYEAYTFPTTDGTSNQLLKTNGAGVVSFGTIDMEDLGNVNVTSPVTNQVLTWNNIASEWQNGSAPVPTLQQVTDSGASTSTTVTLAGLLQTGTTINVAAGASYYTGTLRSATLGVGGASSTYDFPTADGNDGEVLMTDGAGAVTYEKARSLTFSKSGVHQLTTTTDTYYRHCAATTAPESTYWTRTSITTAPTSITRTAQYSKAGHNIPVAMTGAEVEVVVTSSISASASSDTTATEYNGDTITYYLYRWDDGSTAVQLATWTDTFNGGVSYAEEVSTATATLTANAGDQLHLVARCLTAATATRYWTMNYTINVKY